MQEKLALAANQQTKAQNEANAGRSKGNMQAALISEFKNSLSPTHGSNSNNKKAHIKPDEVRDGTLEDLILSMKSEPYRAHVANDGMSRKSFRRQRSHQIAVANNGSSAVSEAL